MRRGFLLTSDAFLGLVLMAIVMLMVASQDYGGSGTASLSIRSFSMDMLTSFEKSGLFEQSLSEPSKLREALNALPPNICARITIADSTNATVINVQNENCENQSNTYVFYRTFYAGNEPYLAKSEAWYK